MCIFKGLFFFYLQLNKMYIFFNCGKIKNLFGSFCLRERLNALDILPLCQYMDYLKPHYVDLWAA